ncbi:non-homologous end-joining DNA ligase [Acidiferrimicrobium sp. IK]|uniref:non-homologous end-joining DNA ligase n=1 Tax=Acidiferrimicrobium sp. IK TaxID=2871700 RepID=UPI0021CB8D38|nr:non-homologous end-joining DNA ligase [Acidiferrimicrobium sp. IK]
MATAKTTEVEVGGRSLKLSNLDKVLWPATGFTKGDMIDYYARIAPAVLPHISGRPLTLKRYPNGVDGTSFFEKNCPSHRPDWVPTIAMGDVAYCSIDEPAALVWLANLAAIELHPTLAGEPDLDCPRAVVFDLDPGPPADVVTCGRVALLVRGVLDRLDLQAWIKTSGSKGLQLYVPLNTPAGYDATRDFALAVAQLLERAHPDLVVTSQEKRLRPGKVLIDWSQNTKSKTTVAVYSLRARDTPSVSTPVAWDEVEAAVKVEKGDGLRFDAAAVLARVADRGDLMAPLLEVQQSLPDLRLPER